MPWFRVDDTFAHHAKVMAAGNGAVGLWTRAGAWCMQQLTDGFVPDHVAATLGSKSEAKRLVDVGLWLREDEGYRFHQWDGRQPSREKVEADRHAATERQRVARERAKSQRESQRDKGVSHGPPDPTRPDPTHNYVEPDGSTEADASEPPARSLALVNDHRPDVEAICLHLAEAIESTGIKKPAVTQKWRTEARLMLDRDGRTVEEVDGCIRWLFSSNHTDAIWWRAGRIQGMPKLREKFDALKLQAQTVKTGSRQQQTDDLFDAAAQRMGVTGGGL